MERTEILSLVSFRASSLRRNVTNFKVGDRVGCSNLCSSCLRCEQCVAGKENLCKKTEWLVNQGGFGAYVRLHCTFVFALPPSMPSELAAPLMCAGSTVYPPFKLNNVKAGQRVAVVGIGGLGHLALQFARAWGTEVTALSTSKDKEAEAKKFGAHHFVSTADTAAVLKTHTQYFDFMLVTVTAQIDWAFYLALLRNGATLCCCGIPGAQINLPSALDFVTRELHLVGAGGCSRTH